MDREAKQQTRSALMRARDVLKSKQPTATNAFGVAAGKSAVATPGLKKPGM